MCRVAGQYGQTVWDLAEQAQQQEEPGASVVLQVEQVPLEALGQVLDQAEEAVMRVQEEVVVDVQIFSPVREQAEPQVAVAEEAMAAGDRQGQREPLAQAGVAPQGELEQRDLLVVHMAPQH
jgi:hypothetical protein